MNTDVTTIKITKKTKARLDKLKIYKRETYDDIIQKMLTIMNYTISDPLKAKAKLTEIERTRKSNS